MQRIRIAVNSLLALCLDSVRKNSFPCLVSLLLVICHGTVCAQDYITRFRGDEVGPRSFKLDEETFLNILSYEHSLESIQPWLASKSGYRAALGSLTSRDLWLEQDLKHTVTISDSFRMSAMARQAVDLDSDHVFIQPTLEYQLARRFEILVPTGLTADKGDWDGGLGLRFRDPDAGVDYVQLAWIRADFLFEDHSRTYKTSRSKVRDPADTLDLQAQGSLFDLGRTSLKIAYQLPSDIRSEERGRDEEFQRFSAWLLHRYDLNDRSRLFFEYEQDSAGEEADPFLEESATEAFFGDRDLSRARLEYQRDLAEDGVRRFRGGIQYLYYNEDEELPAEPLLTHTTLRRESVIYAGYRIPLGQSDKVSLETMVYLDWLNNRNRYPYNHIEDGRDPSFQGKISFYFHWAVHENVDFILDPSFELDTVGWGGGGIQLRCRF